MSIVTPLLMAQGWCAWLVVRLVEAQQAPWSSSLSIRFLRLTAAITWTSGLDGDAHMITFCDRFPSLLLISISVLWAGKETRGSLPPNSIIASIMETIVFSHPIPDNGEAIAWPQIEKAIMRMVPGAVAKIVRLVSDTHLATFVMTCTHQIHTVTFLWGSYRLTNGRSPSSRAHSLRLCLSSMWRGIQKQSYVEISSI